jgi:hypothetical protein
VKTFEEAVALVRRDRGTFEAQIPDGWQQGRGAFGGLSLALMMRAIEASEPDASRHLRTLSAEICAPVLPGPARVVVEALRRGSSASYWDARIVSPEGSEVLVRASAMLSAPRKVESTLRSPKAPELSALEGLEPLAIEPPLGPAFARAFEYRTPGPYPFSGSPDAQVLGSIRLRKPPAAFDAATLLAYADAWWPSWLNTVDRPRATATVNFTAELLVDPATLDPAQPLVHVGRVHAERDGYVVELRELWAGETLVLLNQQTFAILS